MNYIVRADYYPNGEVVPLGITDHNGNTLYLKEMEMSRSPGVNNFRFVFLHRKVRACMWLWFPEIMIATFRQRHR